MATKKKSAKPAAKKAAPKSAAKKSGKKKEEVAGVSMNAAAVRSTQEEGSIAPTSQNLVSAFALFKKKKQQVSTPTVTRLAAGSALPRPPAPKPPTCRLPSSPCRRPLAFPPVPSPGCCWLPGGALPATARATGGGRPPVAPRASASRRRCSAPGSPRAAGSTPAAAGSSPGRGRAYRPHTKANIGPAASAQRPGHSPVPAKSVPAGATKPAKRRPQTA